TPAPVPEAARYAGGEARENRDIEQTHLVLGFEGPSFREAGFYPAQVFSTLYGGGMSSRLFQEVREKRGLVYAIYSFASSAADTGLVGVYAGTAQESAEEVLAIVRGELEDLAGDGPDEDELARARAQLRASLLMARESTSSRCEQLAQQLLVHNRPIPPEELAERVEAVSAAEVMDIAARYAGAPPSLVVLGP
ncbi:MAG: pitrilysin family protein, partial [Alphaproteobacteria bacterium]|nr:pitrilysin family protein [Alphaproteobacteria bacterium]